MDIKISMVMSQLDNLRINKQHLEKKATEDTQELLDRKKFIVKSLKKHQPIFKRLSPLLGYYPIIITKGGYTIFKYVVVIKKEKEAPNISLYV